MLSIKELEESDYSFIYYDGIYRLLSCINESGQETYITIIKNDIYVCKISIFNPIYIEFIPDNDYKIFRLSKEDKSYINDLLRKDNNKLWIKNIYLLNDLYGGREVYSLDLPIPDYMKLPE